MDIGDERQRARVKDAIRPFVPHLKRYTYTKHILARLGKHPGSMPIAAAGRVDGAVPGDQLEDLEGLEGGPNLQERSLEGVEGDLTHLTHLTPSIDVATSEGLPVNMNTAPQSSSLATVTPGSSGRAAAV